MSFSELNKQQHSSSLFQPKALPKSLTAKHFDKFILEIYRFHCKIHRMRRLK